MPVSTYTAAASRSGRAWCILVRIEGIGTFAGQTVITTNNPDYSTALYRAVIRDWPSPISERAPRLGGLSEAGAIQVEFVDYEEWFSEILRLDRGPASALAASITSSATSLTLSGTVFPESIPTSNGLFFIDGEALTFTTRTGSAVTGVTRGVLGTTATAHDANALIYQSTPYIRGRDMAVYMGPLDGASSAAELLLGHFKIDTLEVGKELSSWTIGGVTDLKYLNRRLASYRGPAIRVGQVINAGSSLLTQDAIDLGVGTGLRSIRYWSTSDLNVWFQAGDKQDIEIIRGSTIVNSGQIDINRRGVFSSKIQELKPGTILRQVVTSDPTYGDIRISPGPNPSESRTSGTWNRTAHWIDILLAFMTSSAHPDDGLELVNHRGVGGTYNDATLSDAARSNWSSLQIGFGIGIPANLIDLTSFMRVKLRTQSLDIPSVVVGAEPEQFVGILRQFLQTVGAFLTVNSGLLSIALPRVPLTSESLTTWTTDDIIEISSIRLDLDTVSSLTYELTGPAGSDQTLTLRALDLQLLASRGLVAEDESTETIDAHILRTDSSGINTFLVGNGLQRLSQLSQPAWRIRVKVDGAQWNFYPGGLVAVTHTDLPNLETGVRGWSGVICQILEKNGPYVDEKMGSVVEYELVAYAPNATAGRVASAANVVSSALNGSNRDVTVTTNRFSSPDVSILSLPVTDAAAFVAGDVVQEYTRVGVATGATRTVVAVAGDVITISGTGAPTAGNILAVAAYASQVTAQRTLYASMAGITTMTVDGASVSPYRYAGR